MNSDSPRWRTLLISYHFAPVNVSATHRAIHFARALSDRGHQVDVLTGTGAGRSTVDPTLLEIFPYPKRVHRVAEPETLAGQVVALRDRLTTRRSKEDGPASSRATNGQEESRPPGRIRSALRRAELFPDAHRSWYVPAVRAGKALGEIHAYDAIVATGPPWTALCAGWRLANLLRVPLILDFRDPWSWLSGGLEPTSFDQYLASAVEARLVRRAELLIFNSPQLARLGGERNPGTPVDVVLNGSAVPRNDVVRPLPSTDILRFRHFGSLYGTRSLRPLGRLLADAAATLGVPAPALEQYGSVERGNLSEADGLRPALHGPVPFEIAARLMAEPAVLLLIQPTEFTHQIPTKLYDYLATGNPVVVFAQEDSATWELAQSYERCILLPADSLQRADRRVRRLIERWYSGTLIQEDASDTLHLDKEALGDRFVDLVERTLNESGLT